jgi:O-antigen biosynthesis protein
MLRLSSMTFETDLTPSVALSLITGERIPLRERKTLSSPAPKITIVTPSYNQGEFLEACIDSVLSQGYDNLEYIIMDGGSTDNSVEILKKYEKFLAHWESGEDGGHYNAVNKGFSRSTGAIMGWLNSDDMLHPKALQILGSVFATYEEIEFVTGRRIGFDREGKRKSFGYETQRWNRDLFLDEANLGTSPLMIMQEATYWRRSLWEKAGARLDTAFPLAADFELWARFFRYAKLHTINGCIGGFREHGPEQRSVRMGEQYFAECRRIIAREWSIDLESDDSFPPLIEWPLREKSTKTIETPLPRSFTVAVRSSQKPVFSIITPSFNQAQYLEECIESVLSQKECNIEYIIMDGGSTDGSVDIIRRYEKHLAYWQSTKDGGQYQAIQEGFKRSQGPLMAWLNSDDKYCPDVLSTVVDAFLSHPQVAWITGLPSAWQENGELLWNFRRLPLYSRTSVCFTNYADPYIQQESTFWTRALWQAAGGYFDSRYKYAADLDLWRRFFRYAQLYSLNLSVGGMRIHPDQTSQLFQRRYKVEADSIVEEEIRLYKAGEFLLSPPAPEPIMVGR